MKAITICQPYAHLIALFIKRVENRTWPTRYRGPILIHAGMSRDWLDTHPAIGEEMAFGAVVATANLIDCVHIDDVKAGTFDLVYPWLKDHEHASGPYCFILADVKRLEQPVPMKGRQGLFDIEWPIAAGHDIARSGERVDVRQ
jgi:hypothetical protein